MNPWLKNQVAKSKVKEEVRNVLLTQNHCVPRKESICSCGRKSHVRTDDRNFFIGEKKITIKNLAYFYCPYCKKASYDSEMNIDEALKYAYQNGLQYYDWNEYIRKA
ncbi:MAG: YgiT-type zinc finger domain-containing protein [Paenibacillus macerans]|nr:YgiT-type zinc finger domain-containing protein [Paenibacillus macerans]